MAALLYLGAVTLSWPFPVRLLYDGLVPLPPYRWVHPPAYRTGDNEPPQTGAGTVPLGPQGSRAAEINTDDEQALVTLPAGAIAARAGETSVKVSVTPLDPATVAPAPAGTHFDGNAYRIDATYAASATQAVIAGPVTVVLRYAVHGTMVLQAVGSEWKALPTTRFDGSQQVLANTDGLGIYVPAGPGRSRRPQPVPATSYAAGPALLTAIGGPANEGGDGDRDQDRLR